MQCVYCCLQEVGFHGKNLKHDEQRGNTLNWRNNRKLCHDKAECLVTLTDVYPYILLV